MAWEAVEDIQGTVVGGIQGIAVAAVVGSPRVAVAEGSPPGVVVVGTPGEGSRRDYRRWALLGGTRGRAGRLQGRGQHLKKNIQQIIVSTFVLKSWEEGQRGTI